MKEIFKIPNLVSLVRVLLIPFIGYYLAQPGGNSILIAFILILVAGITDGLDGFLARKMNQVSDFGIAFDPIADKIFAGLLIVLLVIYREFPLWLGFVIVGRDFLILSGGLLLLRGRKVVLPSNITGKYTFGAIAALLTSYVIRFEFGILWFTYITIIMIVLSLISYSFVFVKIRNNEKVERFQDTAFTSWGRKIGSALVLLFFIYKLYQQFF